MPKGVSEQLRACNTQVKANIFTAEFQEADHVAGIKRLQKDSSAKKNGFNKSYSEIT